MPEFRKVLDIYQGYNFKKDKQTPVGFITKMKLGDKELKELRDLLETRAGEDEAGRGEEGREVR